MQSKKPNTFVIIVISAFIICAGIGALVRHMPPSGAEALMVATFAPAANGQNATPSPLPTVTPDITIHVVGAVNSPGVYSLPKGSRAVDAVEAAGGLAADADESGVNLAAVLSDGQQVLVPALGQTDAAPAKKTNILEQGGKININTAPKEELTLLPGIGEALATSIIQYREANGGFQTVEELTNVPKIGEKTLQNIIAFITVE